MNQQEGGLPCLSEVMHQALNAKNERVLLEVIEKYSFEDIQKCFEQEPTLFHRICAQGFHTLATFFLEAAHIDPTIKHEGRTALQWACLNGHQDIVQLLLPTSIMEQRVWQDNSEFYSASLAGNIEIIRCLFQQHSYLLKDDEVRTSLLYAACIGGNIDVVKFWLIPGMDVNKPVELVSALRNCELMVPLYAACEGQHKDAALLLMEHFGGELTKCIIETFPEFAEELVNIIYDPVRKDETEVKYILKRSGVHFIHQSWLFPLTSSLTTVILRENKIVQLESCLPWLMPNLIHLDVSHNALVKFLGPSDPSEILCQRLEEVDLSYNLITEVSEELFQLGSLTLLNLSHNQLQRLTTAPAHVELTASTSSISSLSKRSFWKCSSLLKLNVSHNALDVIPPDIMGCLGLKYLDVSHNYLSFLPSAWACSLEYLDASHNSLERFPPSTEDFWRGSLVTLNLQHNKLDQLRENILKLGTLQKLDVSHNHIEFIIAPEYWDCPSLTDLNLSNNQLGLAQNRKALLEFPTNSLVCLNLSDNNLCQLPLSVCYMSNLASLDISRNPLKDLPPQMGRLTNCWDLKLQDLNIQNRQLRDIIQGNRAQEIIGHLRDQLRRVESTYILKTIVLGPPGKGKSTVIRTLAPNCGNTFCDTIIPTTVSTFKESKVKIEGRKDKPKVTLRIWELPGTLELMAMHPVLWTENCLFLLVWDMAAGINHLDHWLCGIKARLEKASVIIVGTMCDRIQPSDVLRRKEQFLQDINKMYEQDDKNFGVFPKDDHRGIYPHLSDVVLVGLGSTQGMRQGTQQLRSAVYLSALSFVKNPSIREYIVGQKLPQSYLKIDEVLNQKHAERLTNNQPPFLTKTEFDELISTVPDTDFHTFDDLQEAVTVWCQMGSLLHYDVWTEGLCNLYFLDPDWLVRMIAAVLLPSRNTPPHRQTLSTVQLTLTNKGLPEDILKAFLQLLKHFDIGAEITEQDQNILLLPCRLPREAPGLQLHRQQYERKLLRFYSLPHVPARLWSRLILGLLLSKERFSQSRWFLGARPHEEEGSDKTLHSSRHGFRMQRLHMMYWQTGLSMTFDGGSVVMETCVYRVEEREIPGILIFISSITRSLSNLAVVGFVSDELYAAIQNIFPHHCEDPEVMNVFALCPVCHDSVEPGQGTIEGTMLHFELHKCAAALLQGDFALCHTGCRVALEELVPEFLFTELPRKFHLHIEDIHVSSTKLGGGAAGSVFKGKLGDKDTAVKVFYSNELPTGSPAGDSGVSSVSSGGSQTSTGQPAVDVVNPPTSPSVESTEVHEERPVSDIVYGNFAKQEELFNWLMEDRNESRSLKICRAFSELRQEVAILSKLRHPCIVALYGVCVRPSLLVALELAPLGSLRSVLKANVSLRPPFNKYTDRDKIFSSVLHKNITFKIIYQVANGLHYLHKNKVLYRDLKSDNVLICSLDPSDDINVKISDYGISKFATPQGMMGMVGTPGYMAPEIMYGQAYDEKVDIFSFAMVIYETLTGHQPFESYPRLHQLNQIINFERRRPSLKEYNVVPCFPYLESLMHEMWEHEPNKRPSAVDVMKRMQDVSFLLQCAYIKDPEESLSRKSLFPTDNLASCIFCNITCAWASQEPSIIKNRNTCWIWEFPTNDTGDRRLSVYNLASNQFHIHRKTSPGQPVTCMTKVGSCMWVGVQAKYIEIFGNSCTDIPRCQNQLGKLQAEPRCIIHDKHNPKKSLPDGEGFVYVGLSDGTIAIYEHYRWHRNDFTHEWKLRKELTLRTTQPVSAMCLVPNPSKHELWVACGHALFVVSSDNFLVAEKLCVKKELSTSAEMVSSIACIVKAEDSLWCSFKGSPLIVEFSISQKMVLCALCLEADIIEEISIEKVKLHRTSDCQECIEERGHRQPVQHGKPGTSEDPTELPPPRPPRSTILSSTLTSGMMSSFPGEPLQPQNRKFLSLPREMSLDTSMQPPPRPPKPNKLKPLCDSKGSLVAGVEEDPPQVPPRRGRSKSENNTLGFARELSPPIPPRRTLPPEHHKVHVQSLLIIRGMLWVGTSKGEVILINTKDLSKSQDTANTSYSHPADRAAETSSRPEDTVRTSVNTDCGQICSLKPIMLTTARALNPDSQSGSVHFLLQAQNLVVAVHNMGCDGDGLNEVTMWEECSYEQITEIRQYWQSLRVLKARVEQADSLDVLENR